MRIRVTGCRTVTVRTQDNWESDWEHVRHGMNAWQRVSPWEKNAAEEKIWTWWLDRSARRMLTSYTYNLRLGDIIVEGHVFCQEGLAWCHGRGNLRIELFYNERHRWSSKFIYDGKTISERSGGRTPGWIFSRCREATLNSLTAALIALQSTCDWLTPPAVEETLPGEELEETPKEEEETPTPSTLLTLLGEE